MFLIRIVWLALHTHNCRSSFEWKATLCDVFRDECLLLRFCRTRRKSSYAFSFVSRKVGRNISSKNFFQLGGSDGVVCLCRISTNLFSFRSHSRKFGDKQNLRLWGCGWGWGWGVRGEGEGEGMNEAYENIDFGRTHRFHELATKKVWLAHKFCTVVFRH